MSLRELLILERTKKQGQRQEIIGARREIQRFKKRYLRDSNWGLERETEKGTKDQILGPRKGKRDIKRQVPRGRLLRLPSREMRLRLSIDFEGTRT